MINVSDEIKQAYDVSTTQIDKIILDGQEYRISNVQFDDDCYDEGNIFGTAIARNLEFEIENAINLDGKEFEYLNGIKIGNVVNWINLGKFMTYDTEPNDTTNIAKISAMDYMLKSNIPYISNLDYESGTVTLLDVLQEGCANANIELATTEFPNSNFIVDSNQFEEGTLIRQVFQAVAGVSGTFAKIKNNNKLYFITPKKTGLTVNDTHRMTVEEFNNLAIEKIYAKEIRFSLSDYSELILKRNTHPINAVSLGITNVDGENITLRDEESILQDGENVLAINDNPFAYTQEKREQLITALFNAVKGFSYTSYKIQGQAKPYLETGDEIVVVDKDRNSYLSFLFRFNYKSPNGLESEMSAPSITNAIVKYQNLPSALDVARHTEFVVNKLEGIINLLTEENQANTKKIAQMELTVNTINSSIKLIGGNNLQSNSIGAYGTEDYEQSEDGTIVATEEELLKSSTDNGFGRIIYIGANKWFKFKSEGLTIGETYTLSFKYSNTLNNQCTIKLLNNTETTIIDTLEEKELESIEYTFIANTEIVELYVSTGDYTLGITDYYLQAGTEAGKWQPAAGEVLSTALSIYYNGIEVTSENSEIITKISNLGFSIVNNNGKVLITFNKDKCILSDTRLNGTLDQDDWLRYVQKINSKKVLLEVKISG